MRSSGWRPMPSCAASLPIAGCARARGFSWAQSARDMLAVYHRAAGVTERLVVAGCPSSSADQAVPVESMSRSRTS